MADPKYDHEHQRIRKELLPYAIGKVCHLCGKVMRQGQDLDLDHTPDGQAYRGLAHAECNRRDGARRQQTKHSRKW